MTDEEKKEALVQICIEATKEIRAQLEPYKDSKFSKADQLALLFRNMDVNSTFRLHMCQAFSIVLGESISLESLPDKASTYVKYRRGCAVKVRGNDNDHNYPLGRTVICFRPEKNNFAFKDPTKDKIQFGNGMTPNPLLIEAATDEEIRAELSLWSVREIIEVLFDSQTLVFVGIRGDAKPEEVAPAGPAPELRRQEPFMEDEDDDDDE
jgi:hypothetical protein